MDEDGQESTADNKKNSQFDPRAPQNANIVRFLDQVEQQSLFSNLLLNINQGDLQDEKPYVNQNQLVIKKIGQKRLRSLEVMQGILQLVYPSNGKLAISMTQFIKSVKKQSDSSSESDTADDQAKKSGEQEMDSPSHPMSLARFLPSVTRRNLVKTLLVVLKEYSYCSISSQLCI